MASTSSTLKFSPLLAEELLGLVAAPELLGEGRVPGDDLAHLLLDLGEIVGVERLLLGEVVVEAVLDHGADRHLRARPQRLHGLRHDVRGVVPDQLERFRVGARDELDRGVVGDRIGEVGELAVEAHGHRALGERRRDRLSRRSRPVVPLSTWRLAPSGNVRVIWWAASAMALFSSHSPHTRQRKTEEGYMRREGQEVKRTRTRGPRRPAAGILRGPIAQTCARHESRHRGRVRWRAP